VSAAQGTAPEVSDWPIAGAAPPPRERRRLTGLDGIRGIAALVVVLHHCYLSAYPGYPRITGPAWAGWLIYGHFSVVVFIVLSGFSLAVSPARSDWRLGGKATFARRRAWRILPPYWAALVFSLAIAWAVMPQPGEGVPTLKSVLVNGFLVQDAVGAPTPNGAFWSIAVEAQLYVAFPLLLLLIRRGSAAVMLSGVGTVVALIGILAPTTPAIATLLRLTPQFAVLFALGVAAAGVLSAEWPKRVPWQWLALITAVPIFALITMSGSVWTVGHFYWIDMLLGIPVSLLLASLATGRPSWLLRVLDTRPIRSLGSFSYSLYLIHAPIVVVVYTKFVAPHYTPGLPAFVATVLIAGTISVVAARLFAAVFEIPFQRYRRWPALRSAIQARYEQATSDFERRRAGAIAWLRRVRPRRRPKPEGLWSPAPVSAPTATAPKFAAMARTETAAAVRRSAPATGRAAVTASATARVVAPTATGTARVPARGSARVDLPVPAPDRDGPAVSLASEA
jgi:peptidoglycan/LPS O-acetylase OafA/YrhL